MESNGAAPQSLLREELLERGPPPHHQTGCVLKNKKPKDQKPFPVKINQGHEQAPVTYSSQHVVTDCHGALPFHPNAEAPHISLGVTLAPHLLLLGKSANTLGPPSYAETCVETPPRLTTPGPPPLPLAWVRQVFLNFLRCQEERFFSASSPPSSLHLSV